MKTIEQLDQEAKQARKNLINEFSEIFNVSKESAKRLADKFILSSVAMVTYQFALGIHEVSGDGSGESLPEVSQKERDSDGWIVWNGGSKALTRENVQVKFRNGQDDFGKVPDWNWNHERSEWDIIAYRIVK